LNGKRPLVWLVGLCRKMASSLEEFAI